MAYGTTESWLCSADWNLVYAGLGVWSQHDFPIFLRTGSEHYCVDSGKMHSHSDLVAINDVTNYSTKDLYELLIALALQAWFCVLM